MTKITLKNFLEDEEFNILRRRMNAPLASDYEHKAEIELLSAEDLQKLGSSGLDIESLDNMLELGDGTLSYKGKRVLIHIRDIKHYIGNIPSLPKYHFANCETYEGMVRKYRKERYVISNSEEGKFPIHFVALKKSDYKKLDVCKNCLEKIAWKGYSKNLQSRQKNKMVDDFSPKKYFEKYPKSHIDLSNNKPKYTADTAPINDYPKNWDSITKRMKEECNYTCQQCGISLQNNRQNLHIHHKDGQQNNNKPDNLIVLCANCHAEQPMHGHMKRPIQE